MTFDEMIQQAQAYEEARQNKAEIDDAVAKNQFNKSRALSDDLRGINEQIRNTWSEVWSKSGFHDFR